MKANQEVIQSVENEIARTESNLKAQKMLLEQLRHEPSKPFIATTVGRGLNAFIAVVTKPFASLHHYAEVAAHDPQAYIISKVLERADAVVAEAKQISDRTDPKAKKITIKAMRTRLEVDKYEESEQFAKRIAELLEILDSEIQRLRPEARNDQAIADANKALEQLGVNNGSSKA